MGLRTFSLPVRLVTRLFARALGGDVPDCIEIPRFIESLPPDAKIHHCYNNPTCMAFQLVVESAEWPEVEDGHDIPNVVCVFDEVVDVYALQQPHAVMGNASPEEADVPDGKTQAKEN